MASSPTDELLLAAIRFSDDAIITKTLDGIITSWNPAAERTFGFDEIEAVGQPIFIVIPDDRHEEEREIIRRLNLGEQIENFETVRRTKGGRLIEVSLSVSPVPSPTGELIGATKIVRDISKQKEIDRQFRQAQKMEAVGQLTGGVAHDFNNILSVIMGTIEILGEELNDRPDLQSIVKMIDAAASRGAELTGRLLAFARKQPLSPSATDVNETVEQIVKLLKHTIPENIDLSVDLKPNLAAAMVDPDQLVTAVLNLAINARDAMPEGGKLTIETADAFFDDDYVAQHPTASLGQKLMIAVSDNGCGISEEIRDKVFEPFFTTKGVGRGSGLGLSMVYGFVRQSHGHVNIYSEVGVGTTVKIYLPQASGAAEPSVPDAGEVLTGKGERILVVEDDQLVRETTERQLKLLGYAPIAFSGPQEALAWLRQGSKLDLLLTDVVMPGPMNGRILADEGRRSVPDLKVVFMSGYTENAIIHHGRLDPGVLLLTKPFRRLDLGRGLITRPAIGGWMRVGRRPGSFPQACRSASPPDGIA